jgi:predicted MFS family arabinose efflux permease
MSGPAASVAAASLVPPERRGSALAMVSGGMTLAFVVGIPIGSVRGLDVRLAGHLRGRRDPGRLALAAVPVPAPRARAAKREGGKLQTRGIWPLYLTSFLTFAANMTLNLYIAPIVRVGTGITGAGVASSSR